MTYTVLVADDSSDTRALIAAVLEGEGYRVILVEDGTTALSRARELWPDLVLLDAVMSGISGFEVCAQIKTEGQLAATTVIFMTGLVASEDIVRGFRSGGNDYVTKPLKPDALLARIGAHLQRARSQRQADMAISVGGRAALIVDRAGEVQWQSSRAEQLLRHYLDIDTINPLPAALVRWLGAPDDVLRPYKIAYRGSHLTIRFAGPAEYDAWMLALIEHDDAALTAQFAAHFMLTTRQAEVLLWVSRGKTNAEIATILSIAPRTVDKHIEHIFPQVGAETRAAAAAIAFDVIN